MPRAAEERVHRVALHALEEVPAKEAITLHMPDLGFHGGSAAKMAVTWGTSKVGFLEETLP